MSFSVLLRALVLFVIATRGSSRPRSPRVTTPDSFEYVFKDESLKLIKVGDGPVRELKDISTGVYSLKLAATRGGCGPKVGAEEYLGFNNRTCTSSLAPSKTAGPVMRGPSSSMMWREWLIRVQNKGEDRVDVTLQAFMHPALEDQGKCLGYVSNYYGNPEYRGSCVIPPYGNGLFLNGKEDTGNDVLINPQVLSITTAPSGSAGEGAFELTAANKPDVCMRALAVEDCDSQAVLVEDPAEYFVESKKYKTWILTKRYDVVPKTSPPPPLSPPPASPPPPAPIPGPRIEPSMYGQSIVTSGFIEISVKSLGGNSECSVSSIVLTMTGSDVGSVPQGVEVSVSRGGLSSVGVSVPLPQVGKNTVYAVGVCQSGGTTERSNVLSVLYEASGGVPSPPSPPSPPPPPTFSGPFGVYVTGSTAFISNFNGGTVTSCAVGGTPTTLSSCTQAASGFSGPSGMAASGSTLFIGDDSSGSVNVCTMSGSTLTCGTAVTGFTNPRNVAISGTTAFIAQYNGPASNIKACSIGGSPVTLSNCALVAFSGTAPSTADVFSIFASGSNVFFSRYYAPNTVTGCTFTSTGTPPVVTLDCGTPTSGFSNPSAIFVDGSFAFVGESGSGNIKACAVSGTPPNPPTLSSSCSTAASGFVGPWGIFISGSTAFVTDFFGNTVSVCTVSGSPPVFSGCQVVT